MKPGTKHDADKPRWDLLPLDIVEEVVKVLTYGAKKYAPNNWKQVSPKERYFAAAMRHIAAWHNGERIDRESGCLHLACAICSLIFLIWHDKKDLK